MQKFSKPVVFCTLVLLALVSSGCPFLTPPNYLPSFLVTPDLLVFGKGVNTLTFTVAKSWTSTTVPQFTVTPNQPWISVTPTTGTSSGPSNKVTITVTLNRSLLGGGENSGQIVVSAPGVAQTVVDVTADSVLSANFVADKTSAAVNDTIQFTDLSLITPESGPIIAWEWDFGDGSQSTQRHPRHEYALPGLYSVELTVSTATVTNTRRRSNYILVTGQKPIASFTATPRTIDSGDSVQFTDLSVPGSSPIISWLWDFGDGGNSTLQNPSHIYSAFAIYTTYTLYNVTLTVSNIIGSNSRLEPNFIQVNHTTSKAQFGANPTEPADGETVLFQDMSEVPESATTVKYLWEFGDGGVSTLQNPTHTYASTGAPAAYDVKLTVEADGVSSSVVKSSFIKTGPDAAKLAQHVNADDPSYSFSIVETISASTYTASLVQFTSQKWPTPAGNEWTHWLVLVEPANRTLDTALLYIGEAEGEPDVEKQYVDAAIAAQTPVAVVYQVPNEPNDGSEDLVYPMVKSIVAAMDTVDTLVASDPVDGYIISGNDLPLWTTSLIGDYGDARVKGVEENVAP